jgi:hypothetical protein
MFDAVSVFVIAPCILSDSIMPSEKRMQRHKDKLKHRFNGQIRKRIFTLMTAFIHALINLIISNI